MPKIWSKINQSGDLQRADTQALGVKQSHHTETLAGLHKEILSVDSFIVCLVSKAQALYQIINIRVDKKEKIPKSSMSKSPSYFVPNCHFAISSGQNEKKQNL